MVFIKNVKKKCYLIFFNNFNNLITSRKIHLYNFLIFDFYCFPYMVISLFSIPFDIIYCVDIFIIYQYIHIPKIHITIIRL